jgi:hydroxymethylbilane synthase
LEEGRADLAVHSLKDVPMELPEGFTLACVMEREDPRDALIARNGMSLSDLPRGATLGTSSVRRQALLLNARPDLKIVLLRGNVETRLNRVLSGDMDATILALAGLKRLGKQQAASAVFSATEMLPAVAQGTIGIEMRSADGELRKLFAAINHVTTDLCVTLEREFLTVLDGSCKTPIAGLATREASGSMAFRGSALSPDGKRRFDVTRNGQVETREQAQAMGRDAGNDLLARAGRIFFQV